MQKAPAPSRSSNIPSTRTSKRSATVTVTKLFLVSIAVFISLSLAVTYFFTSASYATGHEDNIAAFKSFAGPFQEYKKLRQEWRPRLFSNYLAGLLMPRGNDRKLFEYSVGLWNAGFFLICCAAYIIFDHRNAVFLIFGTFASLYYAFSPLSESHIYPWDMPALLFYVLMYCAYKRSITALLAVLWVGTGFKETVALGSILFLFWPGMTVPRKLAYFFAGFVGCISVKLAIDLITGNPSPLFTMTFYNFGLLNDVAETSRGLSYNIRALSGVYLNHPIFVNAGTFVIFLLLLPRDPDDWMWKTIGVLFLGGILLFGVVNEARVFFEMIPIALWAIVKKFPAQSVP
ncbi:hypothetical protein [Desulfomonile tiedjei]|uniref:DUF2029 domain-containing protein n=1 Tax=Desulfomonile tiedjei (strain ATCC 49306 / DSM 6799 / DCB-1) TaxID=706587 RepID=I4CEA0_DESTA|nr:hypothetical protein [Desulfomonile tiedjei]AFM27891.1 hypothetical protein Desti_5302 [Desulfomonile tiedjei DSM 6799]